MFFIPMQDLAEDLQLVAALPSCVRDSHHMYAVECPRKFTLMGPCFPELPVYRLNIRYRLLVECRALLISKRLLGSQQEQFVLKKIILKV